MTPVGYFVCPEHGDVYRDRIGPATDNGIYAKNLEAVIDGTPLPSWGDEMRCPFCRQVFFTEVRAEPSE